MNKIKKNLNIIGYPQGAFGIAEDARSLKKVFDSLNCNSKYILPTFREIREDEKINKTEIGRFKKGDLNIFAISPMDMINLALSKNSNFINDAGYSVGAWPWELPFWPEKYKRVTNFVNEIWAQSNYVRQAFSYLGDVKVRFMPMLVNVVKENIRVRKKFNLLENNFIFYTVLDGNSWISRKNPIATVRAFHKAFGNSSTGISLVIKAMNINQSGVLWDQLISTVGDDTRITIINQKLCKQELINLVTSCDCFVSLHRSEGFGRNIAEAMMLGVPVIVSNFSGNTDFCNYETSFLVDGDKVPVRPSEYLFYENQYWFEADINEAAKQMQTVLENSNLRHDVVNNAMNFINENYSLKAIMPIYQKTINELNFSQY